MIIRGKIVYVYDIEVFQNIFHCSVKNTETNDIYKFEISERKNQLRELVKFFKQVDKYITWGDYYTTNINIPANVIFCGYNNLHYDNPIINYIIEYEDKLMQYNIPTICSSIFNLSKTITTSSEDNTREMTKEEKADFLADQKGYGQRYLQLIIQEKRRLKRKRDGAE